MAEKSEAIAALSASTDEFLGSIEGLTAAQWEIRPVAEKWSIAEVAEHTATVLRGIERLCRTRILQMPISGDDTRPRVSDAELVRVLADSGALLPAPDMVKPKGRWATPGEVGDAMRASSDLLIGWARETTAELRSVAAPHPLFGPLDGIQWLLMVGAHSSRHARQVTALRRSAAFPGIRGLQRDPST